MNLLRTTSVTDRLHVRFPQDHPNPRFAFPASNQGDPEPIQRSAKFRSHSAVHHLLIMAGRCPLRTPTNLNVPLSRCGQGHGCLERNEPIRPAAPFPLPRPAACVGIADRAVLAQPGEFDRLAVGVGDLGRLDDQRERLGATDLEHVLLDVMRVLLQVIGNLLRRHAVGLGLADDVLRQVVLVDRRWPVPRKPCRE